YMWLRGKLLLQIIVFLIIVLETLFAERLSFVVSADNRGYGDNYRKTLHEINDMTVNPDSSFSFPQFFVSCGDIDPVISNMAIYTNKDSFPNLPPFYPVVGNHEFETPEDMDAIMGMIPKLENIVNRGPQASYSFDYGNIHGIVLDEYAENTAGEVAGNLLQWLRDDMNKTTQDHIFIFGHEPAFPRFRHETDGLNQFLETRNIFWNTLVEEPRVRAYFCGHTHYYSRMRVNDPQEVGSDDFPDHDGGVYQVDVGAIGNTLCDGNLTLVYVEIYDDSLQFRAVTVPLEEDQWQISDTWSIKDSYRYHAQINEPLAGDEVSGQETISWSIEEKMDSTTVTTLYISNDAGSTWESLYSALTIDSTYVWNTEVFPDGILTMLKLVLKDKNGYGLVQSSGIFTINNPGNAIPEVKILSPKINEAISGEYQMSWLAGDADGDVYTISCDVSTDNLYTWQRVFTDQQNLDTYLWDTQLISNSSEAYLRLKVMDTNNTSHADTLRSFEIYNEHLPIKNVVFDQISGNGDAIIDIHVINLEEIDSTKEYQINFAIDALDSSTIYSVRDKNTSQILVENARETSGLSEGPLFDGMRLVVREFKTPEINPDSTGWLVGMSDLKLDIYLPSIDIGSEILRGVPLPYDYVIDFYDDIVDSSDSELGVPLVPVKFTFFDKTNNQSAKFLFNDNDNNNTLSRLDEIFLFDYDFENKPYLAWSGSVSGEEENQAPIAGDKFLLKTRKPLTSDDKFVFSPISSPLTIETLLIPDEIHLNANYPNPFNHTTYIKYSISKSSEISIKIYNIMGQEIKTLYHGHQSFGSYQLQWDGRNKFGRDVSSGLYILTLNNKNNTKKIKMLLMK
ncbi:T9SS type A sorting domain-containing protein, partial [bacterium]|nr:T9SS type A sorting domain-containing protein [bacterium]